MDESLKPQTVLVTGCAGFIGNAMWQYLKSFSHLHVYGSYHRQPILSDSAEICDLTNADAVLALIANLKPDIIFHLAGKNFSYDWQELFNTNVLPTKNICTAIINTGLQTKLVTIGSAAEYGLPSHLPITENATCQPLSPYGQIKRWQTELAIFFARQGVNVSVARVFNVLGKNLSPNLALGAFIAQLRAIENGNLPRTLNVGTLSIKRDYLTMQSLCEALHALAINGKSGEIYNVCSGQSISHNTLINALITSLPKPIELIYDIVEERNRLPDIYGCNRKLQRDTEWRSTPQLTAELIATLNEALWT